MPERNKYNWCDAMIIRLGNRKHSREIAKQILGGSGGVLDKDTVLTDIGVIQPQSC